jgi:hypothetical protein
LNSYVPPLAVNDQVPSYRVAQTGRRAWMIEWWEFDGGQWFPQFRANWQEEMYRQCVSYGVESVTLLGWKLSAIEHNVRYLSEFCWHPELTAEGFYADYAQKVYGPAAASLAKIFLEYDRFEPDVPCGDATGPNMHFSSGWCSWDLPKLPISQKALDEEGWKFRLGKTPGHIEAMQKFYHMDQQAIAGIDGILPQLDEQGASWARLLKNRLETRGFYIQMMLKIDELVVKYDETMRSQGIQEARQAAAPLAEQATEYARLTIERYAREVRNRGDLGVIAQVNEQVYRMVRNYARSLRDEESSFAKIDWTTFRMHPAISFDFSEDSPWGYRDGKANTTPGEADGKPVLRVEIGDGATVFNSLFIRSESVDLEMAGYLDFMIRTTATEPLAIMFQAESDPPQQWRALNLIGTQTGYANADSLPVGAINDGNWHRVTWNLQELYKEQITSTDKGRIKNLILGSWEKPSEPIVVEFRDFSLGRRNTLD